MDLFNDLLLWLHLLSLGLGGAAVFGIIVVSRKMPAAPAAAMPILVAAINGLSSVGRVGIGLLLVTGPLLVWLKDGGVGGYTYWFWVKMVLVAALLGVIIFAGINGKRAQGGDKAAAARQPMISVAGLVAYLAVIASAVLAFH